MLLHLSLRNEKVSSALATRTPAVLISRKGKCSGEATARSEGKARSTGAWHIARRVGMPIAWFSSIFSAQEAGEGYEICLGTRVAQLSLGLSVSLWNVSAVNRTP